MNISHRLTTLLKPQNIFGLLSLLTLAIYLVLFFIDKVNAGLFNPAYITEDGLQQSFPFWEQIYPGRFSDDLLFKGMRGYLYPLHWLLGSLATKLFQNPVMAGHLLQVIQLLLSSFFIWLTVRALTCWPVANLAVVWFLWSPIHERMAGGLPRGWFMPICAAFLYCAITKRHYEALLCIVVAALLNPPAAVVIALSYGAILLVRFAQNHTDINVRRTVYSYLIVGFISAAALLVLNTKPPEIGAMISYQKADQMPEFQRGSGRFKILPFASPLEVFGGSGLQAFWRWSTKESRLSNTPSLFTYRQTLAVLCSLALILAIGAYTRRRAILPTELALFFLCTTMLYFLARLCAFYLYLPSRYVGIPWTLFFIIAVPTAIWRAASADRAFKEFRFPTQKVAISSVVLCFVFLNFVSGTGLGLSTGLILQNRTQQLYAACDKILPANAVLAGNPESLSGAMLFAKRRMLATSETAHPFYAPYYPEVKRRLITIWRAIYATELVPFIKSLRAEGVTHFIFQRTDYEKPPETFQPVGTIAQNFARVPRDKTLYSKFEGGMYADAVLFRDKRFILVDLAQLPLESSKLAEGHGDGVERSRSP